MNERFVDRLRILLGGPVAITLLALAFPLGLVCATTGCSSEESPADADDAAGTRVVGTSTLASDFTRRVRGNIYSSASDLAVGIMLWHFTSMNIVSATSVQARVGNVWLMLTFTGVYSLKGDEWPLTMDCHFDRKTIWWTDDAIPDVEIVWDEAFSARVQLSGDALIIDGIHYGRVPA